MNEVRVISVDVLTDGARLSKVVLGGWSGSRDKRRGTQKHGGSWAVPNARYAGECATITMLWQSSHLVREDRISLEE